MEPYMSRAMTMIHPQQRSVKRISGMTSLRTSPAERREVAVILSALIIPVQSKCVHVALRCVREREARRHRTAGVVAKHPGGVRIELLLALGPHLDEIAGFHRELQAATIEVYRRRLHADECSDQARERRHRAARSPAGDCREGLALFRGGALVDDEADRPVAFAHLRRRITDNDETEAIERHVPEAAALYLHRHGEGAGAVSRARRHPSGNARTDEFAATRFEVLPGDVPGRCRHANRRPANRRSARYTCPTDPG